jgi:ribosomal 50S subunit-recycling heat shock protein
MTQQRVRLNGSQLQWANYDETEQLLTIEFANHSAKIFKAVPREVFRRLSQAPNAQAYYEDRIEPEYASHRAASQTIQGVQQQLNDLFGAPSAQTKSNKGTN